MSVKRCGMSGEHQAHRWGSADTGPLAFYCAGLRIAGPVSRAIVAGATPALEPVPGDPTPDATELVADGVWRTKQFDWSLTYYVSGPITGYEFNNKHGFDEACLELDGRGIDYRTPHRLPVPPDLEGLKLWKHMMGLCLQLMDQCGAIIMLPGWPQSRGARAELNIAMQRGWPVYYLHDNTLINMNRERS